MYWITTVLIIVWPKLAKKLILLLYRKCVSWHFQSLANKESIKLVGDVSKMEITEIDKTMYLEISNYSGRIVFALNSSSFSLSFDSGFYNHGVIAEPLWKLLLQRRTIKYQIQQL